MRRRVIITCISLSGIIILDSLNAGHAAVMFLLAGIIPGTNIAISGGQMLALFALAAGIVVGRIFSRTLRPYRTQAQA